MSIQDTISRFLKESDKLVKDADLQAKLFELYKGSIVPIFNDYLSTVYKKARTKDQMKRNISPLNIIPKYVCKLSKAYSTGYSRSSSNKVDSELIEWYERESDIDKVLILAHELSTLQRSALIEHYVDDGAVRHRVIPAHKFWVYSNNVVNPNIVDTVIIHFTNDGKSDIFKLYTADDIVAFDDKGQLRNEFIDGEVGNPLGILPFTYINLDETCIKAKPDNDLFEMGMFLPKQFTSLNYVSEYQTHAITVLFNVPPGQEFEALPDSVWVLNQGDDGSQPPRVESISANPNIKESLELIATQLEVFLSTRGIRSDINGSQLTASGISKAIDEADTTDLIIKAQQLMRVTEYDFFWRLAYIHNFYSQSNYISNKARFSVDLLDNINISFVKPKNTNQDTQAANNIVQFYEKKLIGRRTALKMLFPELSDMQIEDIMQDEVDDGQNTGPSASE